MRLLHLNIHIYLAKLSGTSCLSILSSSRTVSRSLTSSAASAVVLPACGALLCFSLNLSKTRILQAKGQSKFEHVYTDATILGIKKICIIGISI